MFALLELCYTLRDAWQDADLSGRLYEWWWVVTHRPLLDGSPSVQKAADEGRATREGGR